MGKLSRAELIESVVGVVAKKYGEQSVGTMADMFARPRGYAPTNNLALDYVIGRPGVPFGRVTEIHGPLGSGKSTLCACIIGAAQQAGMVCVLEDTEHSYTPDWVARYGGNREDLVIQNAEHIQGYFDSTYLLVKTLREMDKDVPVLLFCDSISNLPPAEEMKSEDSTEGSRKGAAAAAISQGLRKLSNLIWYENVALVFISQAKVNPMAKFGEKMSTFGGSAIGFDAGLRIKTARIALLKGKDNQPYGQKSQITAVKNKFTPPFKKTSFDINYLQGVDQLGIAFDFMVHLGTIERTGSWFSYNGERLGQGRDAAVEMLRVIQTNTKLDFVEETRSRLGISALSELTAVPVTVAGLLAPPTENEDED